MRVYRARCSTYALRGPILLSCYVFTDLILYPTSGPSGGSIFRCTTKDRGERRAKGVATPFNPPEFMRDRKPDVLWLYVFAMVQLTRLSRLRRSAYSLASAYCAAVEDSRMQLQSCLSLRTSAHSHLRKLQAHLQPPNCQISKTLVIP